MKILRLHKVFNFEAAHALQGYDGPCKNIHGHSYVLKVCLIGPVLEDCNRPKDGMVMDFADLKKIVNHSIITPFDHALILKKNAASQLLLSGQSGFEKIYWMEQQPSCENMLLLFAEKLQKLLPKEVQLHHLHLQETPTSWAEWHAEDQNN